MLADLGGSVVVFVSTNVDEIVLLVALLAGGLRLRAVVAGQFIGMAVLTAASVVVANAAANLSGDWVRWLGVAPLVMGVYLLARAWLRRGPPDDDEAEDLQAEQRIEARLHSQVLAVAAVAIANGGDNLGVYIPVFANDPRAVPLYAVSFAILTALWCWLGHWLVTHPASGALLRRYGSIILPVVLIAIGVEILIW